MEAAKELKFYLQTYTEENVKI